MLNPSTADDTQDDPTIRRVVAFSRRWGFEQAVVVNLYPVVTSDPREARRWASWVSRRDWHVRDLLSFNRALVATEARAAELVIAAWGAGAWDQDWVEYVIEGIQLDPPCPPIHALGETASGAPIHPLARGRHRVPDHQDPVEWRLATDPF